MDRACRSFLIEYISLGKISTNRGIQWFVPGFVHPLQAVMILLLHLSSCPALLYEEQLRSKHLLEQSFDLEELRLQQRQPSSDVDIENPRSPSKKANRVYCLLMKLRHRVWQRAKWNSPHCYSNHECELQDPTELLENAHPDVERQQRGQNFFTTDRETVQHSFHPEDAMLSEPSETMDLHEYDDILEQFLLPGATG